MNHELERAPSSQQYKHCAIEPIEYIEANGLNFHEGNVVKYVSRWRQKGGVEDLKKAQYYLSRLIYLAEKQEETGLSGGESIARFL